MELTGTLDKLIDKGKSSSSALFITGMPGSTAVQLDPDSPRKALLDASAEHLALNFESLHIPGDSLCGDTAASVLNTLKALYHWHINHDCNEATSIVSATLPAFSPSATTLVTTDITPLDEALLGYMNQLTLGAQSASKSMLSSSIIVAGPLSEESNGEFIDIGIWLGRGRFEAGEEAAVLTSLGLQKWFEGRGVRIITREFVPPHRTAETEAFLAAYGRLKDPRCFCVSTGHGSLVVCFLLGKLNEDWCGLVSIAVASDMD
ncbi:hypothetical protein HYDPIDRAFT_186275 [Hydnomerulius pinastri MD-312]|nr:hypothetical protein HYDPIDRAFT_186275 [Hydnomerulius pinastri MD-312]